MRDKKCHFLSKRRPLVPFSLSQNREKTLNAFVQVGLWEEGQEEEWKRRVGDRLKEKLERAQEGEEHHVLDHEEEHWMQISGIELHHVSLEWCGQKEKGNDGHRVQIGFGYFVIRESEISLEVMQNQTLFRIQMF